MTLNLFLQQQHQQEQLAQVGGGDSSGGGAGVSTSFLADSSRTHFYRASIPITLDLFRSKTASFPVELEEPSPLPLGWQRFLNLETGEIYYTKDCRVTEEVISHHKNRRTKMSRHGKSPKLDLKLNLSPPPRVNPSQVIQSPNGSSGNSSPTSPPSSCVSSDNNSEETSSLRYSDSPEATSMVLVGCPRCLMYVMLSEDDPKCPKCKSTVLLDFLHDNTAKKKRNN